MGMMSAFGGLFWFLTFHLWVLKDLISIDNQLTFPGFLVCRFERARPVKMGPGPTCQMVTRENEILLYFELFISS